MMMYLRTPSCMPCDKNDGESRVLEICTHGSTRAAGLTPAATLLDQSVSSVVYKKYTVAADAPLREMGVAYQI